MARPKSNVPQTARLADRISMETKRVPRNFIYRRYKPSCSMKQIRTDFIS